MVKDKSIAVLIPVYNEADYIKDTLDSLLSLNIADQLIVIDDGSTDDTYIICKQFDVKILKMKTNTGKGAAIKRGLKEINSDIIVFLDGDVGKSAKEIKKLIYPVVKDIADVTIASFPKNSTGGGFGLVKASADYYVKKFTGKTFHDVLSGQRAFKREIIDKLCLIDSGFGLELGNTIEILTKGYRVLPVKVDMHHHITSKNIKGFIHRFRQFIDIHKFILKNKKLIKKLRKGSYICLFLYFI